MPLSRCEVIVMTSLSRLLLGALAIGCATAALAQTPPQPNDPNAPKTRAQVRQDFLLWRAAGYDPNDWLNYPDNAQLASRIVAERQARGNTAVQ
jgi:DNA-binding IclR family transcriptional regulator